MNRSDFLLADLSNIFVLYFFAISFQIKWQFQALHIYVEADTLFAFMRHFISLGAFVLKGFDSNPFFDAQITGEQPMTEDCL